MFKLYRFLERMMMIVSRMGDLCVLAIGNCANDNIDNAMMMAMLMTAMMLQLMMTTMLQLMMTMMLQLMMTTMLQLMMTMMTFAFACYWQLLATDLWCSDSTNTTNKLQQTTDCQLIAGYDNW